MFGLRSPTEEELKARRKFVLSCDFSFKETDSHKPLENYQDGKKSLRTLVSDRYQDEVDQLKEKYHDFFKFPQSCQFQEYQQKKQQKDKDYQAQKKWLDLYSSYDKDASRISSYMAQNAALGTFMASIGTVTVCSNPPLAPAVASLFYLGAICQYYGMYRSYAALKDIPKDKERVKMVLEDWHKQDFLARYDRSLLNEKLQVLDKKKPTQKRQDEKRDLVLQYRQKHPKSRG